MSKTSYMTNHKSIVKNNCKTLQICDPLGRSLVMPELITIFTHVVPSVRPSPTFQNLSIENKLQVRIVIAIGGILCLAEWIIGDTCLVSIKFIHLCVLTETNKKVKFILHISYIILITYDIWKSVLWASSRRIYQHPCFTKSLSSTIRALYSSF